MTIVNTDHPGNLPYIELTEHGRKIYFQKDCLGEVEIRRKINEGEWENIIRQTTPPFVDTDPFPQGTKLTYSIKLEIDHEKKQYELVVHL